MNNQDIEEIAQAAITRMTPREMGLMLYPNARPVSLPDVPADVVSSHRGRYSQEDLESGQFLEVLPGKYTFIMSQRTKEEREKEVQ